MSHMRDKESFGEMLAGKEQTAFSLIIEFRHLLIVNRREMVYHPLLSKIVRYFMRLTFNLYFTVLYMCEEKAKIAD